MLEIKDYAIGALSVALLISLVYNVSPDDNYFCRELGISKYCDRLSSTENTCYPLPDTQVGKKYCSSGWEKITIEEALEPKETIKGYRQWLCNTYGVCEEI